VRRYALAQYLLLAPMVMHFLFIIDAIGTVGGVAYALMITATVIGVGWALEERPFARRVEMLRVGAIASALLVLPDLTGSGWFGWDAPLWARALLAAAALASLALLPASPLRSAARTA
jgi:hypothetical protein